MRSELIALECVAAMRSSCSPTSLDFCSSGSVSSSRSASASTRATLLAKVWLPSASMGWTRISAMRCLRLAVRPVRSRSRAAASSASRLRRWRNSWPLGFLSIGHRFQSKPADVRVAFPCGLFDKFEQRIRFNKPLTIKPLRGETGVNDRLDVMRSGKDSDDLNPAWQRRSERVDSRGEADGRSDLDHASQVGTKEVDNRWMLDLSVGILVVLPLPISLRCDLVWVCGGPLALLGLVLFAKRHVSAVLFAKCLARLDDLIRRGGAPAFVNAPTQLSVPLWIVSLPQTLIRCLTCWTLVIPLDPSRGETRFTRRGIPTLLVWLSRERVRGWSEVEIELFHRSHLSHLHEKATAEAAGCEAAASRPGINPGGAGPKLIQLRRPGCALPRAPD